MVELPFLALIKQIVLVTFFLVFCGVIWWCYLRRGNQELERYRFAALDLDEPVAWEDRNG